ncbi:MAG: undecaprenyl/decaprenyl-phosphate alpha-N-acetylglucosaminyl 1-phosphate transferase [Proteobacteria bacterium]|nr:undecaprenyl/decaprenyl-phosphate alpha-N-acetylglucosaminyl 1-phosphate transferase [Pseudomonadota bacterium]
MLEQTGWMLPVAAVAGAVITLLLVRSFSMIAPRVGLIDIPDKRKQHEGHVPLVGGIAFVLAYFLVAIVMLPSLEMFFRFAACTAILLAIGVLDDIGELRASARLIAQFGVAALLIMLGETPVSTFGDLLGYGAISLAPITGFLFTVFCVMSLINGLNMLDGLDGLAGGVGAIMLGAFLLIAMLSGIKSMVAHVSVLLACLAGFLVFHNFRSPLRRKLVFLGDAGSMVLGLALAWTAIALAERPGATMYPVTAVWVLGLVVLDTTATVLRRLMQKRSPLSAGRDHLHHLLLELGCTPQISVAILMTSTAVMAAVGVLSWQFGVPEAWLAGIFAVLGAVYFVTLDIGWRHVSQKKISLIDFLQELEPGIAREIEDEMKVAEPMRKAGEYEITNKQNERSWAETK